MRLLRTPVLVDVLLALMLTALSLVVVVDGDVGPAGVVLAVLSVAPLAVRQLAPAATLAATSLALAGYALLGYGDSPSSAVGMVIALFTVATLRPRATVAMLFPLPLATLLASYLSVDGVSAALTGQAVVVLLCAWALGDSTRRWAHRAQEAALLAERSVADERTRIARELHDVVAHHMSVVALQNGVARFVVDTDTVAARTAIDHASEASREALADMRRMLQALRTEEPGDRAPQPGVADLDELVDRLAAAGLRVAVTRTGTARPIGAGRELCVFRVAQESLTNVLKHAGVDRARLHLDHGDRVLTLEVVDDGGGSGPVDGVPTPGFGITGMRERAELYGGVLEAGPEPGGGFVVRLRLPVASTAALVGPLSGALT
ncbi:sensor histidine kinase [Nocardioides sp. C4-1]|uniref:sensor histidine kinase n=1 Tax=Nocardioides sp. C4-1 TaxID=3151851 RepID=UPI003263CC15